MHGQVHDRRLGAEHGHEGVGDIGREDHTQMNHATIVTSRAQVNKIAAAPARAGAKQAGPRSSSCHVMVTGIHPSGVGRMKR